MTEIIIVAILLIGCLGSCWAIFHMKKNKKSKKESKKEQSKPEKKPEEKNEESKPSEEVKIKEDIKLTKNSKLKIVKSATLVPKIERVYAKPEEPKEEALEEEPVVVLKNNNAKPKKVATSTAAKSIERVFSGKKEEDENKTDIDDGATQEVSVPNRTPSISDRIEFRNHLAEIYEGFKSGVGATPVKTSKIERIQSEVEQESEEKISLKDYNGSSMFASFFNQTEEPQKKKTVPKISLKDALLAETIMKRPEHFKKNKKVTKK